MPYGHLRTSSICRDGESWAPGASSEKKCLRRVCTSVLYSSLFTFILIQTYAPVIWKSGVSRKTAHHGSGANTPATLATSLKFLPQLKIVAAGSEGTDRWRSGKEESSWHLGGWPCLPCCCIEGMMWVMVVVVVVMIMMYDHHQHHHHAVIAGPDSFRVIHIYNYIHIQIYNISHLL